jgi:predicted DNA-binding transcriptional regulator AlpA
MNSAPLSKLSKHGARHDPPIAISGGGTAVNARAVAIAASYAPEGLSRSEAARYVGLGDTSFMEAVRTGEMPQPRRYKHLRRLVWLKRELDRYLEELPVDGMAEAKRHEPVDL